MNRDLLTEDDVADRLKVPLDWWQRHKGRLYDQGFPRPLPGFGQGMKRWDPKAIDYWLDGFLPGQQTAESGFHIENPANDGEADALGEELRRRAAEIAAQQ